MAGPRSSNSSPAAGGSGRRTTRSQARRTGGSSAAAPVSLSPASSRAATHQNLRVYRDMLVEAGVVRAGSGPARNTNDSDERPAKRLRRPGERPPPKPAASLPIASESRGGDDDEDDEDDEDNEAIEFEDVALPPAPAIQTTYIESEDDEDDDEDIQFEDIDIGPPMALPDSSFPSNEQEQPKEKGGLELNLTAQMASMITKKLIAKRKPISKAERARRVEIHKMHLCCLLVHAARRNRWCSDASVQASLRPLLPANVVRLLNPRDGLSQFGQTESLKDGLQQARAIFKSVFSITERGLKRALWAEEESHLENYRLPDDLDSALDKREFRRLAVSLEGSRDVGAQLFCALLRSVGVEARLVCSLQPLSFLSSAPTLPKPKTNSKAAQKSKAEAYRSRMTKYDNLAAIETDNGATSSSSSPLTTVRRLGHPQAAGHNLPQASSPSSLSCNNKNKKEKGRQQQDRKPIRGESPYPVYWVEVLDAAHQKWQPVDPLVTTSQWRPAKLEPPLSDHNNCLSYAVAFAADGTARDVTRRYAKAYTSKARRLRVDNLPAPTSSVTSDPSAFAAGLSGEEWLDRAMGFFRRPLGIVTPLDAAEETELAATAAREPMPRNVADFKDHPLYALERHLRRHEVLVPDAQPSGTVAAGNKAGAIERIYRRRDVRVAWSADKWYRAFGRVVKPLEIPAKFLPSNRSKRNKDDDGGDDDIDDPVLEPGGTVGIPIYTHSQTLPFVPDPVVDGVVPRNRFGNVDVFVPSMVPPGGVHIPDEKTSRAAFLLGVDYAPALTGFEFKGRQGTAVLRGAVVAVENEDAVRAVVVAMREREEEVKEERRVKDVLRMWGRFLKVLRIEERIWRGVEERGGVGGRQSIVAAAEVGAEAEGKGKVDERGKERGKAKGKWKGRKVVKEDEDDADEDEDEDEDEEMGDIGEGDIGEADMDDDDVGGGGFLVNDDDNEDDNRHDYVGAGGFLAGGGGEDDDDDDMGGGFLIE